MNSVPEVSRTYKPVSGGATVWLVILVISIIVFSANIGMATLQSNQLAGASAGAADLQVLSQQLASLGREAVDGDSDAYVVFATTKSRIDGIIVELQVHYGNDIAVAPEINKLRKTWASMTANATQILANESAVLELAGNASRFSIGVPKLQAQLNEVLRALVGRSIPDAHIFSTLQQVVAISTIMRRVTEIRAGGEGALVSGEALARDVVVYGQVLDGLLNGSPEMGVAAVPYADARKEIDKSLSQWAVMRVELDEIIENSSDLFAAQSSAADLVSGSGTLLSDSKSLFEALSTFGSTRDTRLFPNFWVSVVSGGLLVVSIIGFIWSMVRVRSRDMRMRYQSQLEYNSRNQQAIMRLLDEISTLGEGDLTVRASVTEDMTGAIADAVNYAVEELRHLVATINETSVKVSLSTELTQATAFELAEAAGQQAMQINTASERIGEIASSIEQVSRNSDESAEVAQRSVVIAAEGAGVVRETIQGMDQIRDQIQETSKRIKRLGESSQEIGSIVELINDISEQTNILALNAAVQAASAGETGRGFAVVADEVQRLAERTSGAILRIESLVKTIQFDTNEAVNSMEQTTSQVVSGARLAEDAGAALNEIERVSNALNALIKKISTATQEQSAAATDISQRMGLIREITGKTSEGAGQTAESIGSLAQMAADLQRSVADFKLPS